MNIRSSNRFMDHGQSRRPAPHENIPAQSKLIPSFKSSRPYKPSATDDEVYTEIFEQWFRQSYAQFKNPNFEADWVQEVKRAFVGG